MDLGKYKQVAKKCDKEYMGVTAKSFCRWTLKMSNCATGNNEQRRRVCMVLAPFYAMQYIPDPRFLPTDDESTKI